MAVAAQAAHSPAFRIRVVLLAEPLAAQGLTLHPLPLFTAEESRTFARSGLGPRVRVVLGARRRLARQLGEGPEGGTVLFQRQADILPTLSLERRAARGRRVVLDVDDAVWHDGAAGGHPLARLKGTRRKVSWIVDRADVCIAGNELLAEHLERRHPDVRVIPSLVDVDGVAVREHSDREGVVLGWIGSPTTVRFLEQLRPQLERAACALAPRPVQLHVVGGDFEPVNGLTVVKHEWSEAAEREVLALMDVGLMPLEDTPFTRGKCAYKALQYMAAGIPVVADDVGISAQVIGDGSAGLIARQRDDWVEAVTTLAGDIALRRRLGATGRATVMADFSYTRWIPELATLLKDR